MPAYGFLPTGFPKIYRWMTIHFLLVMAGTFAAEVETMPNAALLSTGTRNHSGWSLAIACTYATLHLENKRLILFVYFDAGLQIE
jgi:hypothetical protein